MSPALVIYVLGVNFMVMKVVGSLFLKNTLQVAAQDEERIKKHRHIDYSLVFPPRAMEGLSFVSCA